ncbi:MAG: hypothetical protein QM752_06670 [Gammaproteobacteria bacterium]
MDKTHPALFSRPKAPKTQPLADDTPSKAQLISAFVELRKNPEAEVYLHVFSTVGVDFNKHLRLC